MPRLNPIQDADAVSIHSNSSFLVIDLKDEPTRKSLRKQSQDGSETVDSNKGPSGVDTLVSADPDEVEQVGADEGIIRSVPSSDSTDEKSAPWYIRWFTSKPSAANVDPPRAPEETTETKLPDDDTELEPNTPAGFPNANFPVPNSPMDMRKVSYVKGEGSKIIRPRGPVKDTAKSTNTPANGMTSVQKDSNDNIPVVGSTVSIKPIVVGLAIIESSMEESSDTSDARDEHYGSHSNNDSDTLQPDTPSAETHARQTDDVEVPVISPQINIVDIPETHASATQAIDVSVSVSAACTDELDTPDDHPDTPASNDTASAAVSTVTEFRSSRPVDVQTDPPELSRDNDHNANPTSMVSASTRHPSTAASAMPLDEQKDGDRVNSRNDVQVDSRDPLSKSKSSPTELEASLDEHNDAGSPQDNKDIPSTESSKSSVPTHKLTEADNLSNTEPTPTSNELTSPIESVSAVAASKTRAGSPPSERPAQQRPSKRAPRIPSGIMERSDSSSDEEEVEATPKVSGGSLMLSSGEQGESSTDVPQTVAIDAELPPNTLSSADNNMPERTRSDKSHEQNSPSLLIIHSKKSVSFSNRSPTEIEKSDDDVIPKVSSKSDLIAYTESDRDAPKKLPGSSLRPAMQRYGSVDSDAPDYMNPEHWHPTSPPSVISTPVKSPDTRESGDIALQMTTSPGNAVAAGTPFNDSGERLLDESSSSGTGPTTKRKIGAAVLEVRDKMNEQTEEQWIDWAKLQLRKNRGADNQLSFKEFKRALNIRNTYYAQRFYKEFDEEGKGKVDPDKIVDTLAKFNYGNRDERLRFLFKMYDVNGDGALDPDEVKTMLKACTAESNFSLSDDTIEKLALTVFEEADVHGSGEISFDDMKAALEKYPDIIDNLNISANNLLKDQKTSSPASKSCCRCPKRCSSLYIQNNISSLVCIILFIIINVALFATCVRYRADNWCLIIARGCGMCLNFDSALVLVFMLRYTLSWLRTTKAADYLPINESITFHKAVGMAILVLSLAHTAAHLGNIAYVRSESPPANTTHLEFWEYLFTLRSGVGFVVIGFGYLSGVIVLLSLIVMVICSMPFIRRARYFEVFYWTHMLYVVFFIVLLMHSHIFYVFLLLPGAIFLVEKIGITFIIRKAKHGQMYIERVSMLPSKVTNLIIRRPANFLFHAGDWVFIKIPAIARMEWHPFTISSAPENCDELWLHVRSAGHWTNRLYDYFDNYEKREGASEGVEESGVVDASPGEGEGKAVGTSSAAGEGGGTGGELGRTMSDKAAKGDGKVKMRVGTAPAKRVTAEYIKTVVFRTQSHGRDDRRSVKERAVDIIHMWKRRHTPKNVRVKCSIDGPYGTPTREIFNTEHAVLIGAGIGVTPFASILQSIMHRYRTLKRTCPNCYHKWYSESQATVMKLRKVHFIWINRDQRCFEWFVNMLTQLEIEAQSTEDGRFDKFLELELYMTSAVTSTDIKGFGLQLALDLMHKKHNRDMVTGLRTRAKAGRPDWKKVFKRIQEQKMGKVKVFFCGAPAVGKILEQHCHTSGFEFAKENF